MAATVQDQARAVEILEWLVAAGADEAIAESPVDRLCVVEAPLPETPLAEAQPVWTAPAQAPAPSRSSAAPSVVQPLGTPEAAAAARALAEAAGTLDALKEAIAGFDGVGLKATATNMVFADGNPEARLMLVGEAPGAEEDRRGLPFVGAAGQLLDRMLAAIGHDRANSYITNIVNWRPPGNRKPSPIEMALCRPFIERHIALVNPKVLVLLGDTAAKTLTDRAQGITRLRGRWLAWTDPVTGRAIPVMPTFHPAFLLRSPSQKREAWIDLLAIRKKLEEPG